jgi:DNA gyrase subunit B
VYYLAKNNNYNEDQIRVLEGLEAVRVRPEMYIGSRDKKGLHHLVWEIVDNSVDEYMAGFCDKIDVTIHPNNSITVKDNGRGIPVGIHKQQGKPTLEVVLTVLHAGGKFGGDSPYKTSGGLHGVGSSCVNALSTHMIATVAREGKIHQIEFSEGKTIKPLKVIGKTNKKENGTTIWFQPDNTIFKETTEYDFQTIYNRLRESAFLNKGLRISLTDERVLDENEKPHRVDFYYENGIQDFLEHLNKKREPITKEIFYVSDTQDDISIETAFQYTTDFSDYTVSFANNIKTAGGGTHETGFKSGIVSVIKQLIDEKELIKDQNEPLIGDDVRVGLISIVSVKVPEPQFEGQTKGKLSNADVRTVVHRIIQENFSKQINDNPKLIKPILEKVMQSYNERISLKRARLAILIKTRKKIVLSHYPKN